ncbi:MAG: hypothetical protein COU29_00110 [Candidatus Magasanikbacteria bacterium CG10_big_fil_rev_8_21_14_0_10_36_32]|uniref:Peptidase S11 D-alanyl-D-alanine carboxypeptidase A N-terminal domain-containing protein n=1 Tax=Candidatus Magasanikbacteria bacterium CG10_big_fil_rev_8_21_14_0_10_36_32 TaxID=1974646 RepID=A0A2M6W7I1_9BACT|nr:MAG: hypothetical protein COU29_00110 [Candidatus Magasanikbacteria bacterium CG10_big_fil_rev_8_21_14_0_10_36_32]
MSHKKTIKFYFSALIILLIGVPAITVAATDFNPHYIISDEEIQNCNALTRDGVQQFLDSRGSYLRNYQTVDASGMLKSAADIIYEAAVNNQISQKFLLVTLQKEQSLITDDSPTARQLDWATGYAVCDGCNLSDPRVVKNKGFGKQVDGAAGIIRWYYDNKNQSSFIKQKNQSILIDSQEVTPQSWATAFLYTYTPHLQGNKNFWKIWQSWFSQLYPNGTLLQSASSSEYWVVQNGTKRKIKNNSILMSRSDPKLAVIIPDIDLTNYPDGSDINFANYSLLKTPTKTYLVDYDTLRPFASDETIRQLGYNPQEIINIYEQDIAGYAIGAEINATTVAPQGVIYQITDLNNAYYLLKDSKLYPITDNAILKINPYKNLSVEKHQIKDLAKFETANMPINFADGTLLKIKDNNKLYVIDKGKKRNITDSETFSAMGYKLENVITVTLLTSLNIPEGEPIYVNNALASSQNKFLGDNEGPVDDLFATKIDAYLVAEYPSGKIISGKNIDKKRPIASLTKLLVAYESLQQNLDLSKSTTYQSSSYASSGNPLGLINGEKIKNIDLLSSMLIGSVNNASRMIAQASGLSEKNLISNINKRLDDWGADNSQIKDVTGLSKDNVSTARDMLKIFIKVVANSTIKDTISNTTYTFRELLSKNKTVTHTISNVNKLMLDSTKKYRILASNSGYTNEAGTVMAILIEDKTTKAQKVIITLGNNNFAQRFSEPHRLANWLISEQTKLSINN